MLEAEDEPLFADRAAGSTSPGRDRGHHPGAQRYRRGGRQQEPARSGHPQGAAGPGDWLRCWQVTKWAWESTGDYWKPVYSCLEAEGLDCVLYHAAQVRRCPGGPRPTC